MSAAVVFLVSDFSVKSPFADENAQKQADDLGAQFTEKFIQDPEHVTLLLTLLEVLNCFCSSGKTSVLLHLSKQLPNVCMCCCDCRSLTSMCAGLRWSCWLLCWRARVSRSRASSWSAPWVSLSSPYQTKLFLKCQNFTQELYLEFLYARLFLSLLLWPSVSSGKDDSSHKEKSQLKGSRFLVLIFMRNTFYFCLLSQVFRDWWTF